MMLKGVLPGWSDFAIQNWRSTDDREKKEYPDRGHHLEECCLGKVIGHPHQEKRQPEVGERHIAAIRSNDCPVSSRDDDGEQGQSEPSQIQVDLDVAVMGLIRVPP